MRLGHEWVEFNHPVPSQCYSECRRCGLRWGEVDRAFGAAVPPCGAIDGVVRVPPRDLDPYDLQPPLEAKP